MPDETPPPSNPDPAGATPPPDPPTEPPADGEPADLGDAGKKALKAERDRAAAAEKKAKALEDRLAELERAKMSDEEKAIADAKAAGRAEGLAEAGAKVAVAEFKAAAAGRIADDDLKGILEHLDINGFLTDGEVDPEKVTAFVDRIVPAGVNQSIDLGQGSRGGGAGSNDPLLRTVQQLVGR